jgi:cyclopropane fatty-acyl-phospholipid synthase-like methyltransferase
MAAPHGDALTPADPAHPAGGSELSDRAYAYYFSRERPAFVTKLLERKHGMLLELAASGLPNPSVLEIGPGDGFIARASSTLPVSRYVAIEGSPIGAAALREQGFEVRTGRVPPVPDGLGDFDVVYASHLIEHLPGPDAVLEFLDGCRKALSPRGRVALVYPDARWMRMDFWDCDYTHQWPSTPRRVEHAAEDAGFAVEVTHHCCLHFRGLRALALRTAMKLYPQRALSAVDRERSDFWYRGKLLFAPDAITLLRPLR